MNKLEPTFFSNIGTLLGAMKQAPASAGVRKVDHVMEVFHTAIADLEAVATDHSLQAAAHAAEIDARAAAKAAAEAEALRATSIADKLKGIFQ